MYRNETDLGNSVKELLPKYGLSRSDLFITSKLGKKQISQMLTFGKKNVFVSAYRGPIS